MRLIAVMKKADQISVRLDPQKAEAVRGVATRQRMSPPALMELCLDEFLPVVASGIYATPIWPQLRERWLADLEEVRQQLSGVTAGARLSSATTRRKAA